jgi:hypothetical protein
MGAPLSSIIADVVMNEMDIRAIRILGTECKLWKRFVDDVLAILRKQSYDRILKMINSIEPAIQFTVEVEKDSMLPFLDLKIMKNEDGSLKFNVYRKPTHSGKYLDFGSEHTLSQRLSVVSSLTYRALTHCTSSDDYKAELRHIKQELQENGFPSEMIRKEINKTVHRFKNPREELSQPEAEEQTTIAIPYVNILSQRIARVMRTADIRCVMVPNESLRTALRPLKDPLSTEEVANCIYRIGCTDCDATYVGETKRRFKSRVTEHKAAVRRANAKDSAIAAHAVEELHLPDWDNTKIVSQDRNFRTRRFKEAVEILNQPNPLNRNEGLKISEVFIPLLTKIYSERNKFQFKMPATNNTVRFLPNW